MDYPETKTWSISRESSSVSAWNQKTSNSHEEKASPKSHPHACPEVSQKLIHVASAITSFRRPHDRQHCLGSPAISVDSDRGPQIRLSAEGLSNAHAGMH